MSALQQRRVVLPLAIVVAADLIVLAGAPRLATFAAGLLLVCILPGYLITRLALSEEISDGIELIPLTFGAGLAVTIVGMLGLQALPGQLSRLHILALYSCLDVVLAVVHGFTANRGWSLLPSGYSSLHLFALLLVVMAAVFLRVANLEYSEFQGDESRALLMAAGVLRGEDNILFLHRKGPAEILIPAAFYGLDGTVTELVARLPFAIGSIAGVLAIYALARRLYPSWHVPALLAGGLLAVDGYLTAFGRLVQYQSVVFLMVALAAWCFYVWYKEGSSLAMALGASFVAVGTLAHYEAVLVLPFAAWLFLARGRQERWTARRWLLAAVVPITVFVVIAGVFYVPFVRHPHFQSDTAEYIAEDRIGGGLLYNNLPSVFDRATFYNSTYYILFLMLGGLIWVAYQLRRAIKAMGWALAAWAVLLVGVVSGLLAPDLLLVRGVSLAVVPFAAVLAMLTLAPGIQEDRKATLLWFAAPFIVSLFLTDRPKTHVYTMFPAWAILASAAYGRFGRNMTRRLDRVLGIGKSTASRLTPAVTVGFAVAAVGLLVLFGMYVAVVFVRHDPDFRRDGYPATRPDIYLTFYGDWSPSGGGFAFPHRGGWKGVGALYAQGVLQGSFRSNEETITTSWYTRQAPWCADSPDYYFISHVTHDRWDIHPNRVRRDNNHFGSIWSDGELLLEIYTPRPVDSAVDYELAELERAFDAATNPDVWLWALKSPVPQHKVDAQLDGDVSLRGYDGPQTVSPGDTLSTVLYWKPHAEIDEYYNVFVHLEVEGEAIWAQSDEAPACGAQSTRDWIPDEISVDGHTMEVSPDTPPGEYPLLAGLYHPMTGERLSVVGRNTNAWKNAVRLGTVRVEEPDEIELSGGSGW